MTIRMYLSKCNKHTIGYLIVATLVAILAQTCVASDHQRTHSGDLTSKLRSQIVNKIQQQQQQQVSKTSHVDRNKPPIIAVITQVFRDYRNYVPHRVLHLASSYVKWIESAGGQVLPVLLNQTDAYYEQVFAMSQGLLLPGGDNLLDPAKRTPMLEAARKLYKMAVDSNDAGHFYPIWGTCLGMELLTVLSSGKNTLANCHAEDVLLNVQINKLGRLFASASEWQQQVGFTSNHGAQNARYVLDLLRHSNVTYHYHHKCVTDKSLEEAGLSEFYQPLAYSSDPQGLKFVSILEATRYPFHGVQFHPEKPAFEFQNQIARQNLIPHSPEAIAASRYFSDFLIEQARQARSPTQAAPPEMLIYNYNPVYLALKGDMYEQRYLWPFASSEQSLDMAEFVDRPLGPDESVSEDID